MVNVFDQGLLNAGFNLVARFTEPPSLGLWLTNLVVPGGALVVSKPVLSDTWNMSVGLAAMFTPHFPYGRGVEPP